MTGLVTGLELAVNHHSLYNSDYVTAYPLIAAMGATWVRVDLSWLATETASGVYSGSYLTQIRDVYNAARANGLSVLFTITDFPSWANGGLGQDFAARGSTFAADFAAFCGYMAAQYAGLAGVAFELCNEPDGQIYFQLSPAPTGSYSTQQATLAGVYVPMVQAAYAAIKAANPAILVVAGVMASANTTFLDACYALGFAGNYDRLSSHFYNGQDPVVSTNFATSAQNDAGSTTLLLVGAPPIGWVGVTSADVETITVVSPGPSSDGAGHHNVPIASPLANTHTSAETVTCTNETTWDPGAGVVALAEIIAAAQAAAGDTANLWVTEVGWCSEPGATSVSAGSYDNAFQGRAYVDLYTDLQALSYVERVFIYDFEDDGATGPYTGVASSTQAQKPACFALQSAFVPQFVEAAGSVYCLP